MANIEGDERANLMWGTNDDDWMWGHDNNDLLVGQRGNDIMYGGNGDDKLYGGRGHDELFGWYGDDIIFGGRGRDYIAGGDGDDVMHGESGADDLFGGRGNDFLFGGTGSDELRGGKGNDWLSGGLGADILDGETGWDIIDYRTSSYGVIIDLYHGTGSGGDATGDVIIDIEAVIGSGHNDVLIGDNDGNHLFGGAGDDFITGAGGNDLMSGGAGDDTVRGDSGTDRIYASEGIDWADGGAGSWDTLDFSDTGTEHGWMIQMSVGQASRLYSGPDGTLIDVTHFKNFERIVGSSADDTFYGSDGHDSFWGGDGDDVISGGDGDDWLYSGRGNHDRLFGGAGNDDLESDFVSGQVDMVGGDDADTFAFYTDGSTSGLRGEVLDFDRTEDDIILLDFKGVEDPNFIDDDAFSADGEAELRVQSMLDETKTRIEVDLQGDGFTDWSIIVTAADGLGQIEENDIFFH